MRAELESTGKGEDVGERNTRSYLVSLKSQHCVGPGFVILNDLHFKQEYLLKKASSGCFNFWRK